MADPQFSYSGDPSRTPRDAVRFYVGDTNRDRPLLDDREVDFAVGLHDNPLLAAAVLAEHLMGKFAREADVTVGPVSKSFSTISDAFRKKAAQLRCEANKRAGVSFPATTVQGKENLELDTTLTQPSFRKGLGDNPFAVQFDDDLDRFGFNGL